MKFLTAILDSLVAFVQRNPLTVLVILLLALGAPALLKGIATMILYAILGLLLFGAVLLVVFGWRVRSMQRRMEEQLNDRFGRSGQRTASSGRGGFGTSWGRASSRGREGEVHVYKTSDTPEKRVSEDVGDYVDFEETRSENVE
ncbi:MAG: DUF4834 family protein [Alistipes sp.]|nr:DUF4834 family protein [Alistipes sp.]